MKISKIASATLFAVALTQGGFAQSAEEQRGDYEAEKSKLETSQRSEKEISSALKELKKYVDDLKNYDPEKHDNGNAKINELMQKINNARVKMHHIGDNIKYPDSNGDKKDYIEYDDGKGNKVKLTKNGEKVEITIKDQPSPKNFALNGGATKDDFNTFFANKQIVLGLMDGFIKKFHEAVEVREDKVIEKEKDYIDEINKDGTNEFLKKDTDAIKKILSDLPRELKETAEALGTNYKLKIGNNSANKEVEITIKDAEHAKVLYDAISVLNSHDVKLEDAKKAAKALMDAGVKLKDNKNINDITDTSKVKEALDIKDFNTVYNNKFDADKKVKDAVIALIIRDDLYKFNQNDKMISVMYTSREEKKKRLKKALEVPVGDDDKSSKFLKEISDNNKKTNGELKIILKSTPRELLAQETALKEIQNILETTANGYVANNRDVEKKKAFDEALAKAKEAGVVLTGEQLTKANELNKQIEEAEKVFKNGQIYQVMRNEEILEVAEQAYNDSLDLRKDAFTKDPKTPLSSMGKDVISIIFDMVNSNDVAEKALILDKNSLVSFIKSNETSIEEATNEIGKVSNLDMVNFSNQLSTQTRLAKLSNPFNEDLALASAINKLSNDKFADNGDSVSSVIKSYTDRFNNDNNIWANVIGAKGKVKDSSNPELHGFSIGYDRAFDNTIVGGYMTLAKSKADSSLINTKASNYQIGFYGRTYIDNSEIDTRVSFGKAKNKIDRYVKSNGDVLTQNGKYDTTYTSLAVDYGYVMNLSDSLFMKPLVGLDYSHSKSKAFKESGDLPLSFNGVTSKSLNAKLGLEFRKYVDDGNYLYITPGFEAEVYKDVKDPVARFIGSNKDIKLKADDKKGRFVTLKTGAELKLTDALSTNINFGVKAKSKQQYFDGTVGLKYKF
ncbi:autotransporter domain protein [Campylobacter pinnipediorum subsp. caledonicus]|uniref:autotransporter outer membrane beta-barrel domain-containing protein n=1 Tax=Campylobacter pinnipediorum TaxID=1965231 RepID=UPI00099496E7|nr:autotransporter outer membrane beta-barrel domain-containing protein [Campylobacter pinnipediorum]AQW86261.1 autotransporter domain protein [Campylobacter pinnipediorum subsp. caledonicus]